MVVGGAPNQRGVVSAANYAARKFGVFSAMPMGRAIRRCPHLLIIPPDHAHYSAVSKKIHGIFARYTPIIEPLSLDEAFLDIDGSERLHGTAIEIGRKIKQDIGSELELVASVGVAPNKFLAKLASDHEKPDGFTVVSTDSIQAFLDPMPVSRIWGVGKSFNTKLQSKGIFTVSDVRTHSRLYFVDHFGKSGERLWQLAHGRDSRKVIPQSKAKSISQETTFNEDVSDHQVLESVAFSLTEAVGFRVRHSNLKAKTVNLKLRFNDFHTITRSLTLSNETDQTLQIWKALKPLIGRGLTTSTLPVRLIGVGVSNFDSPPFQMDLLDDGAERGNTVDGKIDALADQIKNRFGKTFIQRGKSIKPKS